MNRDFEPSLQCHKAVKEAWRALRQLRRIVRPGRRNVLLQLLKTNVRSHVEYCVPVCGQYLVRDVKKLEKGSACFYTLFWAFEGYGIRAEAEEAGLARSGKTY